MKNRAHRIFTHPLSEVYRCLGLASLLPAAMALAQSGTLVSFAGAAEPGSAPPRPNFIFILADDYGIDNVGAYGSDVFKDSTPNMDRLAAEGILFTDAYCHPKCGPTRQAFQSGQYPFRNGVIGKVAQVHPRGEEFEPDVPSISAIMNSAGYRTGTFGKGNPRDYDVVFDTANGQDYYRQEIYERIDGVESPAVFDPPVYSQTAIMSRALDFIESSANAGEPFYCYIPLNLPHVPFHASPDLLRDKGFEWIHPTDDTLKLAEYQAANPGKDLKDLLAELENFVSQEETYLDMNAHIDRYIGAVLTKLDELGIDDNTLILFSGDNGSMSGKVSLKLWDPETESYRTIDGAKDQYGDGGGRVPFLLRWPAKVQGAQRLPYLVDFTDILPTFAELAGATLPEQHVFDGHSLAPLLLGQSFTPREFIFVQRGPIFWIRNQGYRMDSDGSFYDYSDAPFSMTELDSAHLTPEQQAARDRLDYLLNTQLDPKNGINYEAASDLWMNLPYYDWKRQYWSQFKNIGLTSISGDHADPDGDMWPNLFEMAFGTDPIAAASVPTVTAAQAASLSAGQNISNNAHVVIEKVPTAESPSWGTVFTTLSGSGDPVLRATRTDMTQASGSDPKK